MKACFCPLLGSGSREVSRIVFVTPEGAGLLDVDTEDCDLIASVILYGDGSGYGLSCEAFHNKNYGGDGWYEFLDLMREETLFEQLGVAVPDTAKFKLVDGVLEWRFAEGDSAFYWAKRIGSELLGCQVRYTARCKT